MKNKAYIVANEQQEGEVLGILGANGLKYVIGTYSQFRPLTGFPYVIYESNNSNVLKSGRVPKLNIYLTDVMYDGRKEEKMSYKYVVSQEFMNTLNLWRENLPSFSMSKKFVGPTAIRELDDDIDEWWNNIDLSDEENNNRLIAILRWVNGEDVFEVEKPKKCLVRSKETDSDGDHWYVEAASNLTYIVFYENDATRFDTKEEAQEWANAHQEIIEVEE